MSPVVDLRFCKKEDKQGAPLLLSVPSFPLVPALPFSFPPWILPLLFSPSDARRSPSLAGGSVWALPQRRSGQSPARPQRHFCDFRARPGTRLMATVYRAVMWTSIFKWNEFDCLEGGRESCPAISRSTKCLPVATPSVALRCISKRPTVASGPWRTRRKTKTRCSAIAERPRCRVRYSFRQN